MKINSKRVASILATMYACSTAFATLSYNYENYSNVEHSNVDGNVTLEVKDGDNLSKFDMYTTTVGSGSSDDGVLIGGASSPLVNHQWSNNEEVKSVTINVNGGEGLNYILGMGFASSYVTGAVNINVNDGNHGVIVGGVHYPSKVNAVGENGSGTDGYYPTSRETNDITITMNGGHVDEIRGGNNGSSSKIIGWITNEYGEKYPNTNQENPSAIGGDIKIIVNGGSVGTAADEGAIYASASSHAVAGNVTIEINDGSVIGAVVAGGRNSYSFIGGDTSVTITGGKIDGSVYAGGDIDDNKANDAAVCPEVRGSTQVTMTGGEVTQNIYGAGLTDSVKGDVNVSISGNSTVGGNVYGAGEHSAVEGSSVVSVSGGTIEGNVYGAGEGSSIGKNVEVVIDGGDVKGNVYGAGKDSTVAGSSTVKLLSGNVSGTVDADGENSTVALTSVIEVGSDTKTYNGTVGAITGFDKLIVSEGSTYTMTQGNVFATKEQSYTLSTANLSQAVSTLGAGASAAVDGMLTLNLDAAGKLTAGKYMIIDASQGSVDLSNWSADTVTVNGIASFEDLVWEGNVLTFIFRSPEVDNIVVSNWGVFKSSQAFVGTLWGNNRANAVEISPATADGKGGLQPAGRTLAWGTVYAQSARIGGVGADYSLWGGAIGVEHQFVSGRSIGVAVGYDWGTVSPFNSGDIDQESAHFGLYGRAAAWQVGQKGAITLDWSAAVGNTTSECDSISGDWDQNTLQLDARVSYLRSLSERTTGSVFAGLQYFAAEDATAGELGVSSMQNLRTEIGAGLSYRATQKTTVYSEVSVYNDAMRHNPYVSDGGQRFEGTNPGRLGGSVSAGVNYQINDAWSLRGNYSFDAADDSTEHNVNVGAAYQF